MEIFFLKYKKFYCIFSLLFSLLILPISPTIAPLLSMSMGPFSYLLNPSPAPWAVILLSVYESVSILLVSSVCSLDSTYEWNHMLLVFVWLDYFTYQCSPCPSILLQRAKFSFSWLSSIPLYNCLIVVLSTHPLMNTWVASTSWWL